MKSMSTSEFRNVYSEVLSEVAFHGETILLERYGRALAVLMPVEEYQELKSARDKALGNELCR